MSAAYADAALHTRSAALDRASLLESALDAIITIDAEHRIIEFNPSAERIFGYPREHALGRSLPDLIIPERFREGHRRGVARAAGDASFPARAHRFEVTAQHASGRELPVELTITLASARPFMLTAFIRDLTDQRALEHRLRYLADHDPLTGLLNRRGLEQALAARLAEPRPDGALLVLDLDHFKFVNDSLGHAVGDIVIRDVATMMRGVLRDRDRAARLGGDEFAIVLDDAEPQAAAAVARRLIAAVERTRPGGIAINASVGVASVPPTPTTSSELLVAADVALYEAKTTGRARVCVYSGNRGSALTWVERIRAALEDERFVLYSQPIIDLATNAEAHEELLIRLLDDSGQLIPPGAFLPTAETYGLIADIDRWVLRRGVELAAAGRRVHINLSGASIGSAALLDELSEQLRSSGADPSHLVIELTETYAVANIDRAQTFAAGLRRLGCRLALDDFGTGFGSFTYLKHLPADYLKIDMEFVRDMAHNPQDRRVVDSIIGIAGAFGQHTIAEGVEDDDCVAALREAGVGLAQGFHLGRPRPVAPR